ncbi:MAG TPA: hypothetical protein VK125_02985 [Bacillota bacterium]|nr:hypothetical protein [Bacillota bacterium]
MKQSIQITVRHVFALFLFILFAVGFQFLLLNQDALSDRTDVTIESKHSKKGLYLYPRYEIKIEDMDEYAQISKEEFEHLRIGDTISGYLYNENSFKTDTERQFEMRLGIFIQFILYLFVLFFFFGMLNHTKFIKRRKKPHRIVTNIFRSTLITIVATYLLTGFIFMSLVGVNLFHKFNVFNLTEATTIPYDDVSTTYRSHRGTGYTTDELFVYYIDANDESHLTRKAVSSETYRKYLRGEEVTLYYRNNNVDDTFVKVESMKEVWPALINILTIIMGLYLVSVFFLIKKWRQKRQKKRENNEE